MKIKSIILASVSLLALSATAKVQSGKGPTLKIGGSLTAMGIATNQQVRTTQNTNVFTKGNIMFNVGGESSNGLTYGAAAVLELDRAKSNSDRISEAYVYMTHADTGTFMIGDVNGVEKTLMYTGVDVLGGNGGPGSTDLSKLVNTPVGVDYNSSIAPSEDTASKIVYISPNVSGFQMGLSFTPNTANVGRTPGVRYFSGSATPNHGPSTRYSVNQLAGAVSYNKAVNNDLNYGLYLAGTTAEGKPAQTNDSVNGEQSTGFKVHNENQWQFGTLVDYRNFQFGATYFDKGNSLIRTDRKFTNTHGYNAAVGYNLASNTNVSLGWTHTQRKVQNGKAKADIATATLDHVIVPGLVGFVEVDYMKLHTTPGQLVLRGTTTTAALTSSDIYDNYPSNNKNNIATVAMVGTKIRF
ncbi:MAG: hypothetical protein WCG05_05615 [Alphaproteobacteria bacterium]